MNRHPNFFVTDWYIFEVVWNFFSRMLCTSFRISSPCFSSFLYKLTHQTRTHTQSRIQVVCWQTSNTHTCARAHANTYTHTLINGLKLFAANANPTKNQRAEIHFLKARAHTNWYGVATISRLLKITGLFLQKSPIKEIIFCKRDL